MDFYIVTFLLVQGQAQQLRYTLKRGELLYIFERSCLREGDIVCVVLLQFGENCQLGDDFLVKQMKDHTTKVCLTNVPVMNAMSPRTNRRHFTSLESSVPDPKDLHNFAGSRSIIFSMDPDQNLQ